MKQQPPRARRRAWWPFALILLAGAVAYANSLHGPFVFDDRSTVLDNQTIEHLNAGTLHPPHETSVAGRPVANLSFAFSYWLGGRDVFAYHTMNLAIHLACGLLIFAIFARLPILEDESRRAIGLAVALLWIVHPLNTDAVDYISERTESLMALFYLATIYAALRAYDARRPSRWEAAAVALCGLGMATKESMVTAPVAVLLIDRAYVFESVRRAAQSRARLYIGLAATWAVVAALVASSPRELSAGFSAPDAAPWTYLLNQAVMITRYLGLAVWPHDLVLYYGWPVPLAITAVLPQMLLIGALLLLTLAALWGYPRIGVLGALFFLALAPTSSIVPIATEVGAERRMYLPLIVLVTLAVLGARRIIRADRGRIVALSVVVLLLATGTMLRNRDYQSSLRLAETSFERWPTASTQSMLGTELAAAGRMTEAEQHLRAAAPTYPPARYYLGLALEAQGQRGGAIREFSDFVANQPPQLDQVYQARSHLAADLIEEGRVDAAIVQYREIIGTHPQDIGTMVRLGALLLRIGRAPEAVSVFRKAVGAGPDDPSAVSGLAIALASTGDVDAAIPLFRHALELDPANEHARQNLDRALAMRRK